MVLRLEWPYVKIWLYHIEGEKRGLKLGLTEENKKYFAEQLLSLNLGLENRLDTEIGLLSGGQRQAISSYGDNENTWFITSWWTYSSTWSKTQKIIMAITDEKIQDKI